MKKSISIILLISLMVVALSIPANARYNYISQLSAGLSLDDNGLANCTGSVKPSNSDTKTDLYVSLQQKKNGEWKEIDSWSNSGTGMLSITKVGKRYVEKGTYRVVVTAKVYDLSTNKLLEDESNMSDEKTY